MKSRSSTFKFFLLFLIASLLLHFAILFWVSYFKPSPANFEKKPKTEVVFVNPQLIPKNTQSLDLADLPKPAQEEVPDKAQFVSPYNIKVKEETTALRPPPEAREDVEVSGDSKRAPKKPKTSAKASAPEKKPKPKELPPRKPKPESPETTSSRETEKPEKNELKDLALKPQDFLNLTEKKSNEKPLKTTGNKTSSQEKVFEDLSVKPLPESGSALDRFAQDFLPTLKIGDKTYANAFALPDAHYFVKMKRAFRMRFNPREPLVRYYQNGGKLPSRAITRVGIEVAPSGVLEKVFVIKTSGISGHDQEVVETIRASSPFSSPPEKFRDTDGRLKMTWNFVTYIR